LLCGAGAEDLPERKRGAVLRTEGFVESGIHQRRETGTESILRGISVIKK